MITKINGLEACQCGECGHNNVRKSIDLWSTCEVCWTHLVPDEELEESA